MDGKYFPGHRNKFPGSSPGYPNKKYHRTTIPDDPAVFFHRGDNRARTCDPMRVMHVLSQLSYASTAYITTFLQKFNTVFPIFYGRFFMADFLWPYDAGNSW